MNLGESVKKGKFMTKIFFRIMLNEVKKGWKKMKSADVKAHLKQEDKKGLFIGSTCL